MNLIILLFHYIDITYLNKMMHWSIYKSHTNTLILLNLVIAMELFDWMFIISSFIFFISMISAILLMANEKFKTVKIFGVILAILMLPIIAILINYIIIGRELIFIVFLILILAYLIAEFLLDRVFQYDFRSKPSTHIPYIILEYAACFSFVFGIPRLDSSLAWITWILFWALLGALVYYLIKQQKKKKK